MKGYGYSWIIFAASLLGLVPTIACAETSVHLSEAQTLTFPTMSLPSSGGHVGLSINPLNSTTSGSAQIIAGMASRGKYNLSLTTDGSPVSISIDISNVSTGNSGLTLGDFHGFYASQTIDSFPSSTLPLPEISPSSTPLYLGATATADSSVSPGNYSASFDITIFVQ